MQKSKFWHGNKLFTFEGALYMKLKSHHANRLSTDNNAISLGKASIKKNILAIPNDM